MKNTSKDCPLICDLLPNYIENLTSLETNLFIEDHLSNCSSCAQELEDLQGDITIKKINEKEINYLKKYKKKIISSIFLGIFLGILILFIFYSTFVIHRFLILNSLSSKFSSYENVPNVYLEENVTTYQNQRFVSHVNLKYWWKDNILKIEASSTQPNYSFIYFYDTNQSTAYIINQTNQMVNKIEHTDSSYLKENMISSLLGSYYYRGSSIWNVAFNIYSTSIIQKQDRVLVDNTRVYDKNTGLVLSDYCSDYLGNATMTTYQYSFDTVIDDNIQLPNLADYTFIS